LGGIELGYSSDLDLVFLHDSQGERQETTGARPIDNQLFFVRLAQRIVHLLTMHSAAGRLYEVDVRLRPSGKGGLLVTNIDGFADIEFLAQYWALKWAAEYPPVAMYSDTIRQLESVASADLVPQASVDLLTRAYRAYRARTHHLALDGAAPIVPAAEFRELREEVTRLWNATMAA